MIIFPTRVEQILLGSQHAGQMASQQTKTTFIHFGIAFIRSGPHKNLNCAMGNEANDIHGTEAWDKVCMPTYPIA